MCGDLKVRRDVHGAETGIAEAIEELTHRRIQAQPESKRASEGGSWAGRGRGSRRGKEWPGIDNLRTDQVGQIDKPANRKSQSG
jgi:hypothetical protein